VDPNAWYKIRLRCKNGGTAPASNTVVTFSYVAFVDSAETRVEVTGGNGVSGIAQSIPVSVVNGGGVSTPTIQASASGTGVNVSKVSSAASTNPTSLKASAARLYGYDLVNNHATNWAYVKLHNIATTPTAGAGVFQVIAIPPNSQARVILPIPATFATGLGYTIVGGPLDADTTAVGAQQVLGSFFWI
jgi:hypothetical protein